MTTSTLGSLPFLRSTALASLMTALLLLPSLTAAIASAGAESPVMSALTSHDQSAVAAAAAASAAASAANPGGRAQTCNPTAIEVAACQHEYYNTTAESFTKQSDVGYVLKQYKELIRAPCAPFMRLFVCSMHLPMCLNSLLVRPCREFCERIRTLCTPMLLHFGHDWPTSLACNELPPEQEIGDSSQKNLCLRPNVRDFEERLAEMRASGELYGVRDDTKLAPLPPPMPHPFVPMTPRVGSAIETPQTEPSITGTATTPSARRPCTSAEVRLGADPSGTVCAQRCDADFLFNRKDKAFAEIWMLISAVLCFVCTSLAVLTFAMDSERFLFPERPIVWIAACYMLFSLGHILRAALGPEVACKQLDGPSDATAAPALYRVTRHAGHWCAVIFLLLYFSATAGCLWWLLMTVCWYLCAARKWAHEALAQRTVWLHVFAWGVPLILSVVLLVLHRIEADELTHLCVVDASNGTNLLVFSIAPVALSLLCGVSFLVSALCSSVSVRHRLKFNGNPSFRRLETLMTKICLFSGLFALPAACVLAANTYEFLERGKWLASVEKLLTRPHCVNSSGLLTWADGCRLDAQPSSSIYTLKIFMSLAPGLPAGLFVWLNRKSFNAWRLRIVRLFLCQRAQQQQQQPTQQHTQQRQKLPTHAHAQGVSSCSGSRQQQHQHQQLLLLGSGQCKYPQINGVGTTEI